MRFFILLLLTLNLYAINSFEFYEDKTNLLKIEDILKLKDKFIFHKSNKINFGLSKSTFWIKLILKNETNSSQNKFLKVYPSFIEYVDLYDGNRVYKNGSSVNLEARDIKDSNIVFNISLKAKESKTIFLSIKSQTVKFLIFYLYEDLKEYRYNSFIFDGFNIFLFGILTLAIIYNFFIYLYIKDKIFMFYVLLVSTQMLFLLYYTGVILNFTSNSHFLLFFTFSQFFILIFMLLLIKEFFDVKRDFRVFNFIFNSFILISLILSLISFFDINLTNKIKNPYIVPIFNLIVFLFFIKFLMVKRNKISNLFIIGWFIYSLSILYLVLLANGIVEVNFISINSLKFGALYEAIFFSILLSYKFYILKDEKIKALKENAKKEKILIQQSKMAQMGEMIGVIAHQWRQPLNALSIMVQNVKLFHDKGILNSEKIEKIVDSSLNQIDYMSQTISDFRNFFTPNRKKEEFSIKEAIEETLAILSIQLNNYDILTSKDYDNFKINGYKNEFKQVILNIITNAMDELIFKNIKNPKIEIKVYTKNFRGVISIEDNAGGIKEEIIDKIFESYFTTKENRGTGIGLYMSKIIIENMGGEIKAQNITNGAKFNIVLPIY